MFGVFKELKFFFFALLKLELDTLTVESKLLLNLRIREKLLRYVFWFRVTVFVKIIRGVGIGLCSLSFLGCIVTSNQEQWGTTWWWHGGFPCGETAGYWTGSGSCSCVESLSGLMHPRNSPHRSLGFCSGSTTLLSCVGIEGYVVYKW